MYIFHVEVKLTLINHLKVNNSVSLNYIHNVVQIPPLKKKKKKKHLYLPPKHFSSSQKRNSIPLKLLLSIPYFFLTPGNDQSAFCLCVFAYSRYFI